MVFALDDVQLAIIHPTHAQILQRVIIYENFLTPGPHWQKVADALEQAERELPAGWKNKQENHQGHGPVNVHSASDRDIVRAINNDSIDAEDLVSREGWRRICQVRGRYFIEVDEEAWHSLCARRGYLLYRRNSRGF